MATWNYVSKPINVRASAALNYPLIIPSTFSKPPCVTLTVEGSTTVVAALGPTVEHQRFTVTLRNTVSVGQTVRFHVHATDVAQRDD